MNGSRLYLQMENVETAGVDGPTLDTAALRHKCFGNHERTSDNIAVGITMHIRPYKFTLLKSLIVSTVPITIYRNATF